MGIFNNRIKSTYGTNGVRTHYGVAPRGYSVRSSRRNSFGRLSFIAPIGMFLIFAVFAVGIVGWNIGMANTVTTHENCLVTKTDTFATEDGVEKRVYTQNCGEFTVNDNLLTGTLHSGSIYGSIKEGETYDFTATGIRSHWPTMFPNITEATPSAR
jgi:hypothetical protein